MWGNHRARAISIIISGLFLALTGNCGTGFPASPAPTDRATEVPTTESTAAVSPTAIPTPVYPTPVYTIMPEYEGYYMGTVVIATYYTLLEKEQYADAYQLLSASQQGRYSLPQYQDMQGNAGKIIDIVTVQPVRAKSLQEQLPAGSQDTANEITFYVSLGIGTPGNVPGTSQGSQIQTRYLVLTKEGDLWKIGAFSANIETPSPGVSIPPTIDPAFVYDVTYYESLVVISQYYTLFDRGSYEEAYALISPSSPHLPSLEDWAGFIRQLEIKETRIVAVYPVYEPIQRLQDRPTPDPMLRREIYAQVYEEGAHGMAGSQTNGVHDYFVTTVLENGVWKIYAVNTAP